MHSSAYFNPKPITADGLGDNVPRRHGFLSQKIAKHLLRLSSWQVVGDIPNISQAVLLAVPHTSNIDGVFAIPAILALDIDIRLMGKKLDIDIRLMGKKELFAIPVLASFLRWAGVIAIDRKKKGSVLEATIARFQTGEPLFLGLAPEGTRKFTQSWKTGFYYLAMGAGVPIIPVAMDYKTRQIRFMTPFYPSGDIEADLPKIYAYYKGVVPKHAKYLSLPLQKLNA